MTIETITEKNRKLRQIIRDLVALASVPAAWIGREPQQIAESFSDLLMSTLRLDGAYLRLNRQDEKPIELVRAPQCPEFAEWLKSQETQAWATAGGTNQQRIEIPCGSRTLYVSVIPIGINA